MHMCGIVGGVDALAKEQRIELIAALAHRGPDGRGYAESRDARVWLGHTRLSIIDVSERGAQPMQRTHNGKTVTVSYNGELYNYKELQKELAGLGYAFTSDSDTEVLLYAYCQWGMDAVKRFRGMFAFVLWDEQAGKLMLCRDRFGVKPLYYYQNGPVLLFASEMKALFLHPAYKKTLRSDAVAQYFQFGYIPGTESIFERTRRVPPGTYLVWDAEGRVRHTTYWNPKDAFLAPKMDRPEGDILRELEERLVQSFQYRMVADVPVGVFLSGGVDSSAVAALLQRHAKEKLKTFTIGFEDESWSEAPAAKKIAAHLGTDHHELILTRRDSDAMLAAAAEIFDEPFGDSSALPTYALARFAREHVKVALSGDGGDELFFGYRKYAAVFGLAGHPVKTALLRLLFSAIHPRRAAFLLKREPNVVSKLEKLAHVVRAHTESEMFVAAGTYWSAQMREELLRKHEAAFALEKTLPDLREQMQLWDAGEYLVNDILVKTDRATMAVGLEAREPYLDHTLWEFVAQIPGSMKYKHHEPKYLLKRIAYQYIPRTLLDRPKTGFRPPVAQWLSGPLREELRAYSQERFLLQQGLFDAASVARMVRAWEQSSAHADALWLFLAFQRWYDAWMR